MSAPAALVVGAGGVLGTALCEEFRDAGYRVTGLRRPGFADVARGYDVAGCDLWNPLGVWRAAQAALEKAGHMDIVVCNTAHLKIAPFAELAFEDFEESWLAGVGAAFGALRALLPSMAARRTGAVLFSGATGSMRGSSGFAAFAAAKFALRGLAQAVAREYDAHGVHVAHVVLDGVLRGSASAQRFSKPDDRCIEPRAAAALFRQVAEQPSRAWTHEIDLRPSGERF